MTGLLGRGIATVVVLGLWGVVHTLLNRAAPVVAGELAVRQLDNSDTGVVMAQTTMSYFSGRGLPMIVLLAALACIWWRYLRGFWARVFAVAAGVLLLGSPGAFAYYDKSDYTEAVEILPNQSAFLIPESGANQDTQGVFMSVDYLAKNKVALKRVIIPHVKLSGSGSFSDFYIPGARLTIVDRTPYYREWVAAKDRGTAARDESFRFESADSVNISTGIVISASVKEEDAAKFLYWFGTRADKGDMSDPHVVFASVVYGRSLSEVMDTVVRGKVQAVLAREFGRRGTDDDIHQKAQIIAAVESEVRDAFAPKGITVDYVGFAESLTFDDDVQTAINRAFIASKEAERANAMAAALPNLQQIADIEIKRGLAAAVVRWNGQVTLPSFVVVPQPLLDLVTGLLKPTPTAVPTN
jgi:SPFH domain / Band 7 family